MSDLPEMYAQSPRVQPEDWGHTFQANHKCPCYNYYVTAKCQYEYDHYVLYIYTPYQKWHKLTEKLQAINTITGGNVLPFQLHCPAENNSIHTCMFMHCKSVVVFFLVILVLSVSTWTHHVHQWEVTTLMLYPSTVLRVTLILCPVGKNF